MTEGFAPVQNGSLYYEVVGEGPAVILSHAGIADCQMWDPQMAPFAERYRVVRYDVRGFGRSSQPESDYAPHDDLKALLTHLGVERAAIVGVSMSGGIAVDFAVAYPEMVWALVPVAAGLYGFDWSKDEADERFGKEERAALEVGDIDGATEFNVRIWVDGPGRTPDQVDPAIREKVRLMQREIFERGEAPGEALPLEPLAIERLEDIRTPTLAIVGDQDLSSMKEVTDLIVRRVPAPARQSSRMLHTCRAWSGRRSSTGSSWSSSNRSANAARRARSRSCAQPAIARRQ